MSDLGLMNERHACPRAVHGREQLLAPGLPPRFGSDTRAGQDDHRIQKCEGDQRNKGELRDGHGRHLVVVVYGRRGRVIHYSAAECEVAHISASNARFFDAAKRHLSAFWARLVADEVCGRSVGWWLR